MIAIKDDNGTIIVKADSDIDGGVELINTDINNGTDGRIESDQLSHPNETTGALSKSPVNNCLDLFDSLINNSGVSLDSMTTVSYTHQLLFLLLKMSLQFFLIQAKKCQ